MFLKTCTIATFFAAAAVIVLGQAANGQTIVSPDAQAQKTLSQMTLDEKLSVLRGRLSFRMPESERPAGLTLGAGYIPGIPRLGIPYVAESDAGLGVANMGGFMRAKDYATAFPSGPAMASTWDPALIERTGEALGAEARGKGFNVQLAGAVNLVREPRNGRNFEYLGEDPLLAGVLVGHIIRGIQSNHVVSTIKHFALNAQETGRTTLSVKMGEAAMRESDLLAFQIGIEIGQPGSVMCGYNRINAAYACENAFLLNDVLRRDWGYKGWVMSDWGAVHSVSIRAGLDQESGTQSDAMPYYGAMLRADLAAGKVSVADIDRSVLRILRTMNANGLTQNPTRSESSIDYTAHANAAQRVAENGIVLLKNTGNLLPIAATARRILVVGGHADVGLLQGGGSSQVAPVGGPALSLAIPGDAVYHRKLYTPSSPLKALQALLPASTISYDDGTDLRRAADAARAADLVVVFAEQFAAEGSDLPSLNLPDRQDALIDAVASANAHVAVILVTGGPVVMPWLDKVGAVVEAWYPGQRGGEAIARVLTGAVNPSGRLPITFPRTLDQTPNPVLPGATLAKAADGRDIYDLPEGQESFDVTYPEGSNVGYRWYDKTRARPLFAFGHGLSFTTFRYSQLAATGGANVKVSFRITNTGKRAGTETPQVYVTVGGVRRLVGWSRVALLPGKSRQVSIEAEPRSLAAFDTAANNWRIDAGRYNVEVSAGIDNPKLSGNASLWSRRIKP